MKNNAFKLFSAVLVCEIAGIIGSFFTAPNISGWYNSLNKPSIAPPNWVFAPVWVFLYFLMGVSFYLVWIKGFKTKESKKAGFLFSIQLLLNILWSVVFFGLKSPLFAFLEIIILWVFISMTIVNFLKISRIAGLLLVPYIIWVSFAAVLNFFLWIINI
ncbi:MAG: tryptophan-rich sensory protein [Candidatus Pacebacteria bacterium]|nr:tryptophan-rich sensory protein [Candidatus Paceibacterota bacterium]